MTGHKSTFRLFLTMELNPNVPSSLIRQCYKLNFAPPEGIKQNLLNTYKTILTAEKTNRAPIFRVQIHFIIAWLHALVIERLRFLPIGWSKIYDFNESDLRCSISLTDEIIDKKCKILKLRLRKCQF